MAKEYIEYRKPPVFKHNTWVQEPNYDYPADMQFNPLCNCHNDSCSRHGFCKACYQTHRCMDHDRFCMHRQTDDRVYDEKGKK